MFALDASEIEKLVSTLVARMRRAAHCGVWNGQGQTRYLESCRHVVHPLGVQACYSRDTGHHTSGWWKNPDFERCRHLSLSFFDGDSQQLLPKNQVLTSLIVEAMFGRHRKLLWCEPPYSEHGKKLDVWHYRLFCDPAWEPIKPRGEVYNKELTEAGWKSFSDVQEEQRLAHLARQF